VNLFGAASKATRRSWDQKSYTKGHSPQDLLLVAAVKQTLAERAAGVTPTQGLWKHVYANCDSSITEHRDDQSMFSRWTKTLKAIHADPASGASEQPAAAAAAAAAPAAPATATAVAASSNGILSGSN
jgi:hypothetical protein